MANWSVQRITAVPEAQAALTCLSGQIALTVQLQDLSTGNTSVIQVCALANATDPCSLLDQLSDAGYTPNDWAATCPSSLTVKAAKKPSETS